MAWKSDEVRLHGNKPFLIHCYFCNSLLDGVPEYRDIYRKGYECGLITKIISATCCQLSGNHCLSEYMAFLCRKQRKKNKHQSTKKETIWNL